MDSIALVNTYEALTLVRKNIGPSYHMSLTIEPEALLSQNDVLILTARSKVLGIRFSMRFRPKQIGQRGAGQAMADAFIEKFVESGKRKGHDGRTR